MPTIFGKPRVYAIRRPDSDCRPSDGPYGSYRSDGLHLKARFRLELARAGFISIKVDNSMLNRNKYHQAFGN